MTAARSSASVASTGAGMSASIPCSTRDEATAVETAGAPGMAIDGATSAIASAATTTLAMPPRKRSNPLSGVRSTPLRSAAPMAEPIDGAEDEQPDAGRDDGGAPPASAAAATR